MSDACTPHNVGGKLAGLLESAGIELEAGTVEILDLSGQSHYHNGANRAGNDIDRQVPTEAGEKTKSHWEHIDNIVLGGGAKMIGRIITDQRNPSGILGEELVGQVSKFVTDHYRNVYSKIADDAGLKAAKSEFKKGIKKIFAGVDTSSLSEAKKGYFLEYQRYYEREGGELYSSAHETGAGEGFRNLVTNQIQNSLTVIMGNPLEVGMKLPALYDIHTLPALGEWIKSGAFNPFKKLPELEELGVYGFERLDDAPKNFFEKIDRNWEGLIRLTDVPTKNLVYLAGKSKGGEEQGLKAIQEVLFSMRLGDMPRQRWYSSGRGETRLISYTVNTIKLHTGLYTSLLSPKSTTAQRASAFKAIAVMNGVGVAIGGAAAVFPMPIQDAIVAAYPDSEEFFETNRTPLTGLIQTGGVGRMGVAFDIGARKFQKAAKYSKSATEAFQAGDFNSFAIDAGLATAAGFFSFTKSPLGDAQVQKAFYLARDIAKDELDGDLGEEFQKDFFPFAASK